MVATMLQAQNMVYLEHSETLSFDERRLPDAQILNGNVRFRHENALMYCDSAYFYEKTNSVRAFGHVHFEQGDTLHGYGDILYYDGNTKVARLRQHVKLIHKQTTLSTDSLNYNRIENIAYYFSGGTIQDSLNTLSSVWGQYRPDSHQALFRHTVHLQNSSFTLDADTLLYNTQTNIANLVTPTTIVYQGETTILSSNGWYNTANEKSMLLDRSQIIHTDGKQMTGDTIFYDKQNGFGRIIRHIEMADTVQKMTLYGNYGEVYEKEKRGFVTDSAMMIDWSQKEKTYIHADTLFTEPIPYKVTVLVPKDSLLVDSVMVAQAPDTIHKDTTYRQLRAFFHVRAYNKEYQLVCDSMVYNGKDSIITLYQQPLCWNQTNQISADTIRAFILNGSIDHIHGIGSAIAAKQETPDYFDQLSGKMMIAYIRDGEIKQVDVNGNAETIFFPKEDDGTITGINKTQSSYVKIFLEKQQIHHITFTTKTTGTMYPLDQIEKEKMFLVNYFWADKERPASPDDIFARPERTQRPTQKAISATDEDEEEENSKINKQTKRNRKKKNTLL